MVVKINQPQVSKPELLSSFKYPIWKVSTQNLKILEISDTN